MSRTFRPISATGGESVTLLVHVDLYWVPTVLYSWRTPVVSKSSPSSTPPLVSGCLPSRTDYLGFLPTLGSLPDLLVLSARGQSVVGGVAPKLRRLSVTGRHRF